jgi:tRNA threonylcarbamoyl adenosine modification protein (Sua5/YciO/YrdC/YwlC family)
MYTITQQHLTTYPQEYLSAAEAGALFIYPTDTIYGIWAIVSPETIAKVNTAKQRLSGKHYSIIAPSIDRVATYFEVDDDIEKKWQDYQKRFVGRWLTLLLPARNGGLPTPNGTMPWTLLSHNHIIWVRLLQHPFQDFIEKLGQPFITTSCNISGAETIDTPDTIPSSMKPHVRYIIDDGELDGQPSVVINWSNHQIVRS